MSTSLKKRDNNSSLAVSSEQTSWQDLSLFALRHIGPSQEQIQEMLSALGLDSLDQLIDKTVPKSIRRAESLLIEGPYSEQEVLTYVKELASKNEVFRSYIGNGFYNTITPPAILRNILENPGWYTQYTPYQAEIAQGRLEALLNYQTMICDFTGMEIANSSLLDEGTAAAEAMTLCYRQKGNSNKNIFLVSDNCHPHVFEVVKTRAIPLGIKVELANGDKFNFNEEVFGALFQYPGTDGEVKNYQSEVDACHACNALAVFAADLMALALLLPPSHFGADVVVGNSQRFGVPLGFGGPHAAYMATSKQYQRDLPGRIVGVSKDADGNMAYRLALQTREQHIKRDRATSNICTAQVLLAIMASMYAVYHGPKGIRAIAKKIASMTCLLADALRGSGFNVVSQNFFDTIVVELTDEEAEKVKTISEELGINFRYFGSCDSKTKVGISLDETVHIDDLKDVLFCFGSEDSNCEGAFCSILKEDERSIESQFSSFGFGDEFLRELDYLKHPVFNSYYSETELLRYITRLQSKDLSLTTSMIPLGSCTMKLNAAVEMIPVTWPEFSNIHPFAPIEQCQGYIQMFECLEKDIAEITGFDAVSLQPNAGSQGEYAGLLVIKAYHESRNDLQRNICLIPTSAHGTNPASAALVGMKVVGVKCDENGNIDLEDLKAKASQYKDELSCLMVTYPSTHGVFEEEIKEICEVVHQNGGQVYMDGANLNAQVGICDPKTIGADVCHLNLHKTFCIPHGGGGPGMGPIAVAKHLAPFLPGHVEQKVGGLTSVGAVSSAPWGSASILPISFIYIKLMGGEGLLQATKVAILNANYLAKQLEDSFPVLYKGRNGFVAHECILDMRNLKRQCGIDVTDIAKRLMDFNYHAPTVSFPVVETMMIEPTESESKVEIDKFCEAMVQIKKEIDQVLSGVIKPEQSPLRNAPHTAQMIARANWDLPYSREDAAYPVSYLREHKFWPACRRIDNAYGDRNLFCSCS